MVKCAIIYTGEVRTIKKVIDTFRQNVLINNDRHVYAILQSDDTTVYDSFVKDKLKNHLKFIQWFDKNNTWVQISNNLINAMDIDASWKHYIQHGSGSMVEYYQMYLAYLEIEKYEKANHMKYDYIFRIRCDCIVTRPISFAWKNYTVEDVTTICNDIIVKHGNVNYNTLITIFMTSIYDPVRINVTTKITNNYLATLLPDTYEGILALLHKEKYLITFRENVMYFANRDTFRGIYKLGIEYGKFKSTHSHWFDSETQLKLRCTNYGIHVFDSGTTKEIKSLYEYDANNYYDNDGLIKQEDVFFFLQRK
jgi:hypothetical protein